MLQFVSECDVNVQEKYIVFYQPVAWRTPFPTSRMPASIQSPNKAILLSCVLPRQLLFYLQKFVSRITNG
jgi:hypothetical protein